MKHYSISHQMSIASIPPILLGELRPHEIRLLNILFWFWRREMKYSPWTKQKCWPGITWLAGKVGCSPYTISRATSKLRSLGLLRKFQLRKRGGIWASNLYTMGGLLLKWCKVDKLAKSVIHNNRLRQNANNRNTFIPGNSFDPLRGSQKVPAYPAGAT